MVDISKYTLDIEDGQAVFKEKTKKLYLGKKIGDDLAVFDREYSDEEYDKEKYVIIENTIGMNNTTVYDIRNKTWHIPFGVSLFGDYIQEVRSFDDVEVLLYREEDRPERFIYLYNFDTKKWYDLRTVESCKVSIGESMSRYLREKIAERIAISREVDLYSDLGTIENIFEESRAEAKQLLDRIDDCNTVKEIEQLLIDDGYNLFQIDDMTV